MNGLFQSFQNVFKQKNRVTSTFFWSGHQGERCPWSLNTKEEELVPKVHSVRTAVCVWLRGPLRHQLLEGAGKTTPLLFFSAA